METSYVSGASHLPLMGETIGASFDRTVERFGDREALVSRQQDLRYTYAELAEEVERLARGLMALGLEPGDRLGIWAPTAPSGCSSSSPRAKVGVILVNINPAYRTSELEYALRQSGCRVLVAAPSVQDLRLRRDGRRGPPGGPARSSRWSSSTAPDWDELLAAARQRQPGASWPSAQRRCQFDDPINIQYTSGTTGFPKGATLCHHNILNNGFFVGEGCRYTEADRVCIPVPFYHCFGMVMGNLGCTSPTARAWSIPAPAFEPERGARDRAGRALHGALRRADDVHRRARAPATSPSST